MNIPFKDCSCGSKETYISCAGDMCCYPCFKPLEKIIIAPIKLARVCKVDGDCIVKVGDKTIKFFSKYEDYAFTDAEAYKNNLNRELISLGE